MFGVFQPRQRLFAKISRLNADGEYRRVIALIESHRGYENDYELVGLLAQAYIDYAHPSMDAFNDLLQSAVNLLASTQAQGAGDPLWNQRMGVALYWLDRNEEAVPYLRHSLELNPSDSTTSTFLQRCEGEITERTIVAPPTVQQIARYFDREEWKYALKEDRGVLITDFGRGHYWLSCDSDGDDVQLRGALLVVPDEDLRGPLMDACNEWNSLMRWPKAYVSDLDGQLRIYAEMYVTCRHGLTFTNLCLNVKRFITTAEDFFEDITTKFPALLQDPLSDGGS